VLGGAGKPGIGAIIVLVVGILILVSSAADDGDDARRNQRHDTPDQLFATVTRVVDGDTAEVRLGGREEDVRYIGIDTPESVAPGQPVECFGRRASAANERLVEGRRVRLVFDDERRDQYGRLLAYVYVGDVFVNARLVRRGLARTLTISPNTDRAGLLDRLEQAAGNAGRGLWGAC
jgi:micrococcal nuclease